MTRLAQSLLNVPLAAVSLIDAERQWFKSCAGLEARAIPRADSLCAHAIAGNGPLIVPDALADPRFADNPLVTAAPGIRFYAGFPLTASDGSKVGAFCVADRRPRNLLPEERNLLIDLSALASAELNRNKLDDTLSRLGLVRRHAAREAASSVRRFRKFFETSHEGILIVDFHSGAVRDANPCLLERIQCRRDEVLGRKLWKLAAFQRIVDSEAAFRKLRKASYVCRDDVPLRTGSGGILDVEFVADVCDADGRRFIRCSFRGITKRKQSERELHRIAGILRAVVEASSDSIFVKDIDGRLIMINSAGARRFGKRKEEIMGRHIAELFEPSEAALSLTKDQEVLATGSPTIYEADIRMGGVPRSFLITKSPLLNQDGRVVGIIGVACDISDRKLHEELLRRARDAALETASLKADMLSFVSHEFNNLLTSSKVALEVLRLDEEPHLSRERTEAYAILQRSNQRLSDAVVNFLNNARLESGALSLQPRTIRLSRLVQDTLQAHKPLSKQKRIAITFERPKRCLPVRGDPAAISLVISNLISNAIKYTPQEGCVRIKLEALGEPPDKMKVSFEDTGIGIATDDIARILEGRYKTSGTRKAEGFGIGLRVVQEMLHGHGSRLEIRSRPKSGSIFSFVLPTWTPDRSNRGV